MDKLKKEDLKSYDAPETKMSQVELEDGVCAGAISMKAESPHGVSVEAQEVNTDFGSDNDFISTNKGWD